MNHDTDIIEVSDPRNMTIDDPPAPETHFQVLKGDPSAEEIAALVAVLASTGSATTTDPGPQELNLWGHPVDKLRYDTTSWQRTTLWERMHMRR